MFNRIAAIISICIFVLFVAYVLISAENIDATLEGGAGEVNIESEAGQDQEKERRKARREGERREMLKRHSIVEAQCEALTKKNLKSSSSFKKDGAQVNGKWEGVILIVFSAKNPFGVRIDAASTCFFNRDSVELLGITER